MPARAADGRVTRAGQRAEDLEIWRSPIDGPDQTPILLARHARSPLRGRMVVDPTHWAELPDGHTRSTTLDAACSPGPEPVATQQVPGTSMTSSMAASMVFDRSRAALEVTVVRRPLTDYDRLAGLPAPPGSSSEAAGASGEATESLVGAA